MQINVNQLTKVYGEKTVLNLDQFTIHHGDLISLVGNNGAGKTTFFRLILDLIKADSGEITLLPSPVVGEDGTVMQPDPILPAGSEDWKNLTGAYIDEGFLIDFLTPEEYFAFIGKVCSLSDEETQTRVEACAPLMGGEVLGQNKLIRNFSAGNKQKIGIVAAMINRPQLLILDEPFNYLDPSGQNILKNVLTDYHEKTGATIIISSHNLFHTTEISTRIVVLEHGLVVKDLPGQNEDSIREVEDYFAR